MGLGLGLGLRLRLELELGLGLGSMTRGARSRQPHLEVGVARLDRVRASVGG